MTSQYKEYGASRKNSDRSIGVGALLRGVAISIVLAVPAMAVMMPATAQAQQHIQFATARTAKVIVTVGKSEDIHTDQNFVDIMVGDPDVADVNPLTDHALSILGKKIGTTRVTVYGEDKRPVGIFDIEVSYDISRLSAEMSYETWTSKTPISRLFSP